MTLRHGRTALAGARVPREVFAGGRRGIGNFFLDATDMQGAAVRQFAEPITITVSYTPEQLQVLGFNEATLSVYWFDETENAWVALPTQIDGEAHTARAQVSHFSTYNLSDGSSPSAAFLPSLQGFQVGAYTGAATYSIPIDVPAGAGGLKPSINLGYSSAASDGSAGTRLAWQAGWAGKGWDIDAGGYVALNTNAGILNPNNHVWDNYTLVFGGQSFDVVKGQLLLGFTNYQDLDITHWSWNAVDENFTRVRVDHDGAGQLQWHAWTKDGTRYDFTQRLWQRQGDTGTPEIYKWLLTQVIDTHQNKIAYAYNIDVLSTTGVDLHPTYYLRYINWGYGGATSHYRVEFVANPRTNTADGPIDDHWEYPGYPTANTNFQQNTPHEIYRLDSIKVQSSADGVGYAQVGEYRLRYADTLTESMQTDQAPTNPSGQKVLTLLGVRRFDKYGVTALPETKFSYQLNEFAQGGTTEVPAPGWNRLLTVDNGEGGKLTFTYEHTWLPAQLPPGEAASYSKPKLLVDFLGM